jgi:tRNA threonylcarbamoyladenosine biosynthesis protein TsaB
MAIILCIETTSTNCSVALASDSGDYSNEYGIAHCLDLIEDNSDSYSHGTCLHIFIDQILERNDVDRQDLDAVAISKGPGSYTGLRIGVASAKGLCYSLDIPLIAIDTLQALQIQGKPANTEIIIPMVDARRMEVYTSVYRNDNLTSKVQPLVLDSTSYQKERDIARCTFIGSGASKFADLIEDDKHHYLTKLPTALTMCDLAISKYKKSDVVKDIAYFEPSYLKEFQAG